MQRLIAFAVPMPDSLQRPDSSMSMHASAATKFHPALPPAGNCIPLLPLPARAPIRRHAPSHRPPYLASLRASFERRRQSCRVFCLCAFDRRRHGHSPRRCRVIHRFLGVLASAGALAPRPQSRNPITTGAREGRKLLGPSTDSSESREHLRTVQPSFGMLQLDRSSTLSWIGEPRSFAACQPAACMLAARVPQPSKPTSEPSWELMQPRWPEPAA